MLLPRADALGYGSAALRARVVGLPAPTFQAPSQRRRQRGPGVPASLAPVQVPRGGGQRRDCLNLKYLLYDMRVSSDRTAGIYWGAEDDEEARLADRGDPCLPVPANAGPRLSPDGHGPGSPTGGLLGNDGPSSGSG